jgi:FAD synthetase
MSLEELVSKYIASTEHVFSRMKIAEANINLDAKDVRKIVESAKAYLEDAKYYRQKGKLEISLTSIAYCEGLLDALKLIGAIKADPKKGV